MEKNISDFDPELGRAATIVINMQKCSATFLQRQMSIGFTKAKTLVSGLEERGIVTIADAAGRRDVVADQVPDDLAPVDQLKDRNKIPMKNTPEDDAVRDQANTVAGKQLRQFIERFERLESEKKDITDGQKEIMAEAKGRGYDTKVIRKLIAMRKRDASDLAEEQAVMEMYMAALGM